MIYLDYQATTPLAPEAREAMLKYLDGPEGTGFGNPHSPHRLGRQAAAAIEAARDNVAALFPAGGKVIFTSGATEALNLAIRGTAGAGSIAYSAIEHSAVGDTAQSLGSHEVLPVNSDGICGADQTLPPAPWRLRGQNEPYLEIPYCEFEIGHRQNLSSRTMQATHRDVYLLTKR